MTEVKEKAQKKAAKNVLKNNKNVLVASVAAGVFGSVTTLLLTPKSGKELRGDISKQVTSTMDKTGKLSDNTKTILVDFKTNAKEKSKELKSKFKQWNGEGESDLELDEDPEDDDGEVENKLEAIKASNADKQKPSEIADASTAKTTSAKKKSASEKAAKKDTESPGNKKKAEAKSTKSTKPAAKIQTLK